MTHGLTEALAATGALLSTDRLFPGLEAAAIRLGPHLDGFAGRLTDAELPEAPGRVPKRIREMIAGRILARVLMARFDLAEQPLPRGHDRAPVWPQGFVGSITHCNTVCAVAMAPKAQFGALGIDIEPDEPVRGALWDRIARPEELARLAPLDGRRIRWLFSAKEAFFKAQFPVSRRMLVHHDVSVTPLEAGAFTVAVRPEAGDSFVNAVGAGRSGHAPGFLTTMWTIAP